MGAARYLLYRSITVKLSTSSAQNLKKNRADILFRSDSMVYALLPSGLQKPLLQKLRLFLLRLRNGNVCKLIVLRVALDATGRFVLTVDQQSRKISSREESLGV